MDTIFTFQIKSASINTLSKIKQDKMDYGLCYLVQAGLVYIPAVGVTRRAHNDTRVLSVTAIGPLI